MSRRPKWPFAAFTIAIAAVSLGIAAFVPASPVVLRTISTEPASALPTIHADTNRDSTLNELTVVDRTPYAHVELLVDGARAGAATWSVNGDGSGWTWRWKLPAHLHAATIQLFHSCDVGCRDWANGRVATFLLKPRSMTMLPDCRRSWGRYSPIQHETGTAEQVGMSN